MGCLRKRIYIEYHLTLHTPEVTFKAYGATLRGVLGGELILKIGIGIESDSRHYGNTGTHLYKLGDRGGKLQGYAVGAYSYAGSEMIEYAGITSVLTAALSISRY